MEVDSSVLRECCLQFALRAIIINLPLIKGGIDGHENEKNYAKSVLRGFILRTLDSEFWVVLSLLRTMEFAISQKAVPRVGCNLDRCLRSLALILRILYHQSQRANFWSGLIT